MIKILIIAMLVVTIAMNEFARRIVAEYDEIALTMTRPVYESCTQELQLPIAECGYLFKYITSVIGQIPSGAHFRGFFVLHAHALGCPNGTRGTFVRSRRVPDGSASLWQCKDGAWFVYVPDQRPIKKRSSETPTAGP